jgi:NPCBM/NEW2 domain-containing protein
VVGVDPSEGEGSKATLTVEVDGRTKFSEVITVDKTVDLNIDVTKGKTIKIIVTSSNFLDLHDHVTIANPKVTQ